MPFVPYLGRGVKLSSGARIRKSLGRASALPCVPCTRPRTDAHMGRTGAWWPTAKRLSLGAKVRRSRSNGQPRHRSAMLINQRAKGSGVRIRFSALIAFMPAGMLPRGLFRLPPM